MKTWLSATLPLTWQNTFFSYKPSLKIKPSNLLTGVFGLFNTPAEKYGFDSCNILKKAENYDLREDIFSTEIQFSLNYQQYCISFN